MNPTRKMNETTVSRHRAIWSHAGERVWHDIASQGCRCAKAEVKSKQRKQLIWGEIRRLKSHLLLPHRSKWTLPAAHREKGTPSERFTKQLLPAQNGESPKHQSEQEGWITWSKIVFHIQRFISSLHFWTATPLWMSQKRIYKEALTTWKK